MVALECLPLRLTTFVLFWEGLSELEDSGHESEKEVLHLLCTKCTNFRDYILAVLTQERGCLIQDLFFDFFKNMAPKVSFVPLLLVSCSLDALESSD